MPELLITEESSIQKKPFKFNTEAGFLTFKEWIRDIKERHTRKDKVVSVWNRPGITGFNLESFWDNEMKPVLQILTM